MSDIYDLVIYAKGLQASLLLAEAADKGLKTALVLENDYKNEHYSCPFIFTRFLEKRYFFYRFRSILPLEILKKSASNLLIQTSVKHYLSNNYKNKLLLGLLHLVNRKETKIKIENGKLCIIYLTYKFSSDRLTISLLKYAKLKGAHIYQDTSLISSQNTVDQCFEIRFYDKTKKTDFKLVSKSTLINPVENIQNSITDKWKFSACFTYPFNQFTSENTHIYKDNKLKIKIIPWFDYLYFKVKSTENLSLIKLVQILNKHISSLNINEQNIDDFMIKAENRSKHHLLFNTHNYQLFFTYTGKSGLLRHSYNTIMKISRLLQAGKRGKQIFEKTILPGSDLGIDYHPLRIMELADEKYDLAKQILKSPIQFKKLFYRYGSDIDLIIEKAYEFYNQSKNSEKAWIMAEIWFCARYELCKSAESFINTNTHLWMEGKITNHDCIKQVFSELSEC